MRNILCTPHRIGPLTIKNRFIRSATMEGLCDNDGTPTVSLFSKIKQLADGNVGLIIPGFVFPSVDCISSPGQTGMTTVKQADIWKPTINYVHSKNSKLFFQICHCGSCTQPSYIGGRKPKGASGLIDGSEMMTTGEIEDAIDKHVKCAKLCQIAGADGVQLHAAHGFLLSEFLSPVYNRRNDKYGENDRVRIVLETVKEIKKVTNLPISLKINGHDNIDGGVTPTIAASYIEKLLPYVDMFEISCGFFNLMTTIRCNVNRKILFENCTSDEKRENISKITEKSDSKYPYSEGYSVEYAKVIRKLVPKAVLSVVGGNRNFGAMKKLIVENTTNFVSMSRPFIRQPFLIRDFQDALTARSDCVSCGKCTIDPPERSLYCNLVHSE